MTKTELQRLVRTANDPTVDPKRRAVAVATLRGIHVRYQVGTETRHGPPVSTR